MRIFSIEMERISLGGLIIAMGMLSGQRQSWSPRACGSPMLTGQVLARGRRRGGHQNAGPASRGHRDRHHGVCGDRPQSRTRPASSLFSPVRRDRHLAPAFLDARGDRDAAVGPSTSSVQGGGAEGAAYGGLPFRAYGALLARSALRLRWLTIADPGRADGGVHVRFHPDAGSMFFPGLQHAGLFRPLQAAAGDRHPARVRRISRRVEAWLAERARTSNPFRPSSAVGASRFILTYCGRGSRIRATDTSSSAPGPSMRIPALQADLEAFGRTCLPGGRVPHPATGFRPRRWRP